MTEALTGTVPVPGSGVPDAQREPGPSREEEPDYSRPPDDASEERIACQTPTVPEFLVLGRPDGSDRTLVCWDQRDLASDRGFTVVEFVVDAPTRGFARRAWDSHRAGREIEYAGVETDNDFGLEGLTEPELAAVVAFVEALVECDRPVLDAAGAYDSPDADPYLWTHDYGRWGSVDLTFPPGDPRHWAGGVIRSDDDPARASIIVDMWTAQEGPSDLSLEAELTVGADGDATLRFENLHVM